MSASPTPTRSLDGARILIVGASGGLGRPLAAALVARGAHLALAGRDASGLGHLGIDASRTFAFDLADTSAAQSLVIAAADTLGGLDGVICCAGAVAFGPLDEIPIDVVHEIVAVDLLGPLVLARAAIPVLPRGGFILNVSGIVAEIPTAGLVSYSAAKAGISAGFRSGRFTGSRRRCDRDWTRALSPNGSCARSNTTSGMYQQPASDLRPLRGDAKREATRAGRA